MATVNAPKAAPRYILYTRVSTVAQDDNNSHDSQLKALQKHAMARGGLIVGVSRETASGGSYLGRPAIRAALDALENDEADVLACFDFSRYSRDGEHQRAMMKRVERAGKLIEFTNFDLQWDEDGQLTPESELNFGVNGSFAVYHRKKIRLDSLRGKREAAEKGIQTARRSPWGYHIVRKEDVIRGEYAADKIGHYIIIEEQARWIREIFQRRAAGESQMDICRYLNEQGLTLPNSGRPWRPSSLTVILENPVYKGEAAWGKTRTVTDEGRLEKGYKRDKYLKTRPKSEQIAIPCPAIVSATLWNAAQQFKGAPRGQLGSNPRRYLLTGLLVCPVCGSALNGIQYKRKPVEPANRQRKKRKDAIPNRVDRYYRCSQATPIERRISSTPCFKSPYFRVEKLDEMALKLLRQLFGRKDFLATLLPRQQGTQAHKIDGLQRDLEALQNRERVVVEAQLRAIQAGADSGAYEKILVEVAGEKRQLEAQIAALQDKKSDPGREAYLREVAQKMAAKLKEPDAATPGSDTCQFLHNHLMAIFERIEIGEKGELSFVLRI